MKTKKMIAWGDIHGQAIATKAAIQITESLDAVAVFLGDYIDRGPESLQTLFQLIKAKDEHPDWVFLRGNHEHMILPFLQKPYRQSNVTMVFDYQTYEGFYMLDNSQQQDILEFLGSTTYYYETESYIFTHAPLKDYGYSLKHINENEMIWNYETTPYWKGKPFIHGHKAVLETEFSLKGLNINTSCGMGGKLTGVCIPETPSSTLQFYSIDESGEYKNYSLKNQHFIKNN